MTRHWPWGIDEDEALFVPPVSSVGIPAGPEVSPSVSNAEIRRVGDLLLDPKQPVASLDRGSYFNTLSLLASPF